MRLLLLLLPNRLRRLWPRGSFWLRRFQQRELGALFRGHLWLGFLRLWFGCRLLARLNGRRRLLRHRSSRVFSVLQAETRLIPCHPVSAREHLRRRAMATQHGCPCPTRIPTLPEACPRVAIRLSARTEAFAWAWCREPRRESTRRAIPPGGNEDRPADRQHQTDRSDNKKVEQDRGNERRKGFPPVILAPGYESRRAHVGRVLLIRAWWKRYCWI